MYKYSKDVWRTSGSFFLVMRIFSFELFGNHGKMLLILFIDIKKKREILSVDLLTV
jgi:hypothetical protein